MEFFKNLYKKLFGKKCTDTKNCTVEPCCKVEEKVAATIVEAPVVMEVVMEEVKSGLPIENYVPPVETVSIDVITMSPVSITETPAVDNELSPSEKAEKAEKAVEKKKSNAKKKKAPAQKVPTQKAPVNKSKKVAPKVKAKSKKSKSE